MPLTGGKRIDALIAGLNEVASGRVAGKIRSDTASDIREAITDAFEASRGPNGEAWAPLKRGSRKPLLKTRTMLGQIVSVVVGERIQVRAPTSYAGFHQDGTRSIPRRKFLPNKGEAPPAAWVEQVPTRLERALDPLLKGR